MCLVDLTNRGLEAHLQKVVLDILMANRWRCPEGPGLMNRFGLGERRCPNVDNKLHTYQTLLTLSHLHYWNKGLRVPADVAALLIEIFGARLKATQHQSQSKAIQQGTRLIVARIKHQAKVLGRIRLCSYSQHR